MAGVFPGAELDAYWSNIVRGVSAIREVPHERWDPEVYYDPDGRTGSDDPVEVGRLPGRRSVRSHELRDTAAIAVVDRSRALLLDVARQALDDADYGAREFDRERTAVVFGTEGGSDLSHAYGFRRSTRATPVGSPRSSTPSSRFRLRTASRGCWPT